MLQLWKLVLLCGLLTGTSASLLGNLGNDLNDVVGKVKPVVEKGLETVDNTLETPLQKLKADLGVLQESKVWQLAKQKVQEAGKLVKETVANVISTKAGDLSLNLLNSRILDVKLELSPDGEGVNLRVPIIANATIKVPDTGLKVNLKVSLDLLTNIRLEIDPQKGTPKVVVGQCRTNSDSVSISLSDRHLINNVLNPVTKFVEETVSHLLERNVCPLLHVLISSLDDRILRLLTGRLSEDSKPKVAV